MRSLIVLVVASMVALQAGVAAQIVYVSPSATGAADGSSWADAYTDLQPALDAVAVGDEIWVAAGTYRPSVESLPGDPRSAIFTLVPGTTVRGGFAGDETSALQAEPQEHVTILSGDLGTPGWSLDNAYRVVTVTATQDVTVLDGLTITGGRADGSNALDLENGGGMTVRFEVWGALELRRCRFVGNLANGMGGGLFVYGLLFTNVVMDRCLFEGNSAGASGGGLWLNRTSLTLRDSDFIGNVVDGSVEGEIFGIFGVQGVAGNGGGGVSLSGVNVSVVRCRFLGNRVGVGDGGGLRFTDFLDMGHVRDSLFAGNQVGAGGRGGGLSMAMVNRPARVQSCRFEHNLAGEGGAVFATGFNQDLPMDRCEFLGNATHPGAGAGGALRIESIGARIDNCRFAGNLSALGGALDMTSVSATERPAIVSCAFSGNQADAGGAVSVRGNVIPTLLNCSIVGNLAAADGGGVYADQYAGVTALLEPRLVNSILWDNSDGNGNGESAQIFLAAGTETVNYSIVQGYTGGLAGVASHGSDPLFTDADGADDRIGTLDDDLSLLAGSPAIDSGNNAPIDIMPDTSDLDCDLFVFESVPFDLAGVARKADDPFEADTGIGSSPIIDRGALERGAWERIAASLEGGGQGAPCLSGSGALTAGSTTLVEFSNGVANALTALVVGHGRIDATAFYGGTLVPMPDIVLLMPANSVGKWSSSGAFPAGVPSGAEFFMQAWAEDATAPYGLAGTDALHGTTP